MNLRPRFLLAKDSEGVLHIVRGPLDLDFDFASFELIERISTYEAAVFVEEPALQERACTTIAEANRKRDVGMLDRIKDRLITILKKQEKK